MRKIIAGINMTLDGVCDHTAVNPDEEIHDHYADLLKNSGIALYGRITYELMKFWPTLVENPSGEKSMDEFAVAMDQIPKLVFSRTLTDTGWNSAKLTDRSLKDEVLALKQQAGRDILVGSRSLIIQLMQLGLLDELQLCVHPVVAGGGALLFENIQDRVGLRLIKTKTFAGGAVMLYYEPVGIEVATS